MFGPPAGPRPPGRTHVPWCRPRPNHWLWALALLLVLPAQGQVEPALAEQYFTEASELCTREGGKLWDRSLCGPMVFADATTGTLAANRSIPDGDRPRVLGYANTALRWGDERWSTFVWKMIPADDAAARGRLMMHELFHRIQPELGLLVTQLPGENDHLDEPRGRFWLQLEFRALASALEASGPRRDEAIHHALTFRTARRAEFDGAAAREQPSEINEGLAQFTAVVAVAATRREAEQTAVRELHAAAEKESFVRTFAYSTGTAYGLFLDERVPGWRTSLTATSDLGELVRRSLPEFVPDDADRLAPLYDGAALWASEVERERERQATIRDLRARFVEGPVLVIPRGRGASFITTGVTPLPGVGTIYPSYRVEGPWGRLEAEQVLVAPDGQTLTLPGPFEIEARRIAGADWSVQFEIGWEIEAGPRVGDFRLTARTPALP